MRAALAGLAGLLLAIAVAAPAAPPLIPDTLTYQGVLLDNVGDPQTGTVDLTLRVWDSAIFGVLVYTQGFTGVPLTDGVFSVELGPTGAATDTPTNPLTTSLATALAGDPGTTAPRRYLEVTVGAGGAMGRTQILTVPYAMRASEADNVAGIPSSFVGQLFQFGNSDGGGPLNSDPLEGLGDLDGDGLANFIDPDNDGDGITDAAEVSAGTDMNLKTPTVSGFVPSTADGFVASSVSVQGTNFEPGLSVVFGSQMPTPTNITATSFDVLVGPQPPGTVPVTVTLPNSESAVGSFDFFYVTPAITGFVPAIAEASATTTIQVLGTDFDPGISVVFGSESPTPTNVTATSFDVQVGPQTPGVVSVDVTHPNGNSGGTTFQFYDLATGVPHLLPITGPEQLSFAVKGPLQSVVGRAGEYRVDSDADFAPDTTLPLATLSGGTQPTFPDGQSAVAWHPDGDLVGLRCRDTGSGAACAVELLVDSDADLELEDETPVVLESVGPPWARIGSPSIAFDTSGAMPKPVLGYQVTATTAAARVAHDRDGDGLFTGTKERVTIEGGMMGGKSARLGEVAVDSLGRVAYVYHRSITGVSDLRVAYDRFGDGDFNDMPSGNPELMTLASGAPVCLGAAFDPNDKLAVVYAMQGGGPMLAIDADGDGLFTGPGETVALAGPTPTVCDVAGGARLAAAHNAGSTLRLLVDRNGDGDFDDTGLSEDQVLIDLFAGGGNVAQIELRFAGDGRATLATESLLFRDAVP